MNRCRYSDRANSASAFPADYLRSVSLSIADPDNPYRYLGIQGRVSEMTEKDADAHIDRMAKKYLNKDKYPFRQPGEMRILLKITPSRIHTMG